jgi:predicted dehydrogenase
MASRSRRQFLEESMLGAVAAMAGMHGPNRLRATELPPQSKSPNEKLGVAVIGVRHRGGAHVAAFTARKDTEILWIADVDQTVGNTKVEEIGRLQGRRPRFTQDMREVLNDPSVDIVSIATPNHWHALASIWAMQHGKDVYVEKPVSHNISEGRRMVEAARKYNRICQAGIQSRSMTREAIQFLHDGKLGDVKLAHGLCYKPRASIGPRGDYPIPSGIDYDLWLGPASRSPSRRPQFHYDWHWQWPYGNGDLGNQGVHEMDVARWGLGTSALPDGVVSYGGRFGYDDAGDTPNTQVVVHTYGDKTLIFEVRGLKTRDYRSTRIGVIFEGSNGSMVINSYAFGNYRHGAAVFSKDGKLIRQFSGLDEQAHFDNFIKAVRSRNVSDLNADILDGHISSALCHLGNISYRLGSQVSFADARHQLESLNKRAEVMATFDRTMQQLKDNHVDVDKTKLQWGQRLAFDSTTEQFEANSAADEMLTRDYREPYAVPTVEKL